MSTKWRTPVPQLGLPGTERDFIGRLVQWLREQEREPEYDLEETLALGGLGVAYRLVGFEGRHAGYTPPDEVTVITGPAAPGKFVITGLHFGTQEVAISAEIYLRKNAVDNLIAILDPTAGKEKDIIGGSAGAGAITLDASDESIVLKTLATASGQYGWAGSYVNVE